MLRLSLRKDDSTWRFGAPQWGVVDGDDLTATQAAAMLAGKRICVLVHGYNVGDPARAYYCLREKVGVLYDEMVCVYWPGSAISLGFWFARIRASKAGRLLAEALAPLECAAIDIEGHSMGCHVTLEALASGLTVRNCILAAAAVDNESIQRGQKYEAAVQRAQRVLVAYSHRDAVLAGAYRLGCLDGALGWHGPQEQAECLANTICLDCSMTADSHSAYKSDKTFLDWWRSIVR